MESLSDPDRLILEKRKWQLEFASSIIDVCCPICGGPLFFYKVFVCGHLFCDACTDEYAKSKIRINCPIDDAVLSVARIKPEKLILLEKTIYNLRVGCVYRSKGCKEILLLGEAVDHYRRCEFRDLIKQLEVNTEVNLRKLHKLNVPKFLQDDFGFPGFAVSDSKPASIIQECLEEDSEQEPEVLMNDSAIHMQTHTCHFRIRNIDAKKQKLSSRKSVLVSSELFDVDDQTDTQIMAKIFIRHEILDFFLDFKVRKGECNPLNDYKRILLLVDQSDAETKHHVIRFEEPAFGANKQLIKNWMTEVDGAFQSIPMRLLSQEDSPYIKNDEIYFQIIFTPMTVLCARPFTIQDGVLTWDITNYSERKRSVIQGVVQCLRSQYFYSHNGKGYRMQACLYFHQLPLRNQPYLSVYLDFLRGKNDDNLTDLFAHETTFVVYQKSDPKNCVEKVVGNEEGHLFGDRIDDFLPINQIENGYIENDTLSMKVLVKSTSQTARQTSSRKVHHYFSTKRS